MGGGVGGEEVRVLPAEAARGQGRDGAAVIGVGGGEGGEVPVRVRSTGLAVWGEG